MPASKKRIKRRGPVAKKRPSKAAERRARETKAAQASAAKKKQRSLRSIRARKVVGISLLGLAVVVAGTHFMEHLDMIRFASQGFEDLFAGYPMAAALALIGAIILGS